MDIPACSRLYMCPTHDLTGRVWVLSIGIKVCLYPIHVGTVPIPMGEIAILTPNASSIHVCALTLCREIRSCLCWLSVVVEFVLIH
jgi:hypothetical protein